MLKFKINQSEINHLFADFLGWKKALDEGVQYELPKKLHRSFYDYWRNQNSNTCNPEYYLLCSSYTWLKWVISKLESAPHPYDPEHQFKHWYIGSTCYLHIGRTIDGKDSLIVEKSLEQTGFKTTILALAGFIEWYNDQVFLSDLEQAV
jgi:hypothetical protein